MFRTCTRKKGSPPDRQDKMRFIRTTSFSNFQFHPVLFSFTQFSPVFLFSSISTSFPQFLPRIFVNFPQFRPVFPSFAQFCPVLPSFFPVFPSFSPNFYHLKNLNFLTRAPKKKKYTCSNYNLIFPRTLAE